MTKQGFENKYLGKKIRYANWDEGEWFIVDKVYGYYVYGRDEKCREFNFYWQDDKWELYEEKPETIPEKTIKDFPLVEVSWDGKYWEQVRYTYTDSEGSFFDSEGEYWNHMRPIQEVKRG